VILGESNLSKRHSHAGTSDVVYAVHGELLSLAAVNGIHRGGHMAEPARVGLDPEWRGSYNIDEDDSWVDPVEAGIGPPAPAEPTKRSAPARAVYGLYELAGAIGIGVTALANRRARGKVPEPDAVLRCGPIWLAPTVEEWIATSS